MGFTLVAEVKIFRGTPELSHERPFSPIKKGFATSFENVLQ